MPSACVHSFLMPFASQPPHGFRNARLPSYPRVAALGLIVSSIGCQPASTSASRGTTIDAATSPTIVVIATAPSAQAHPESAPPLAEELPPSFAAVDVPVDPATDFPEVSCRGDCASPFQMAVGKKDNEQVQARSDYCARRDLQPGTARLRGMVGKDGRLSEVEVERMGQAPADSVIECVRRLVLEARFTPPSGGEKRGMYATFEVGKR